LRDNTTWDSVADIEKLREHVGIDKWLVFGGSWGSTLALAYAETHPDRVKGLVLRGIFLARRWELEFFYQYGVSNYWPEEYEKYIAPVDPSQRHDMIKAYYTLLTSDDEEVSLNAAKEWSRWESSVVRLYADQKEIAKADRDLKWARAFARIECHYFINGCFMPEAHLISEEQISKIRHIPCIAVNGRYDLICPIKNAHDLKLAYGKNFDLRIIPDAGHSATEPGTFKELLKACDEMATL